MPTPDPPLLTVEEWRARRPTSTETVREEVEPFRHMTPAERLEWFVTLQKSMDAFVRLRESLVDKNEARDGEPG